MLRRFSGSWIPEWYARTEQELMLMVDFTPFTLPIFIHHFLFLFGLHIVVHHDDVHVADAMRFYFIVRHVTVQGRWK